MKNITTVKYIVLATIFSIFVLVEKGMAQTITFQGPSGVTSVVSGGILELTAFGETSGRYIASVPTNGNVGSHSDLSVPLWETNYYSFNNPARFKYKFNNTSTVAKTITVVFKVSVINLFPSITYSEQNIEYSITITPTPPPPAVVNDNYTGATNLSPGSSIVSGATVGATLSSQSVPSCSGVPIYDDVWYKFVATNNSHIIDLKDVNFLYTGNQYGTPHAGIALYNSNLGYIDCNVGGQRLAANSLVIGQTYYIRLWTASAHTNVGMSYKISVTIPGTNAILNITRSGGYTFTASYSLDQSIPLSDVTFEWSVDPGEIEPASNYSIEQGQGPNQIYVVAGEGEGDTTVRVYVRMKRVSTGALLTSWTSYPSLIWF